MTEQKKHIVIIGGVACGPKTAARARRCDPDARITMIEAGEYVSFAGCGMPYYIGGSVPETTGLMTTTTGYVRDPEYFRSMKNVDVLIKTRVDSIDRENKLVKVTDLSSGEQKDIAYDKLVISTGALPIKPPFEGIDLKGVYFLRSLEEAVDIRKAIEENMELENAVIVGGGRISLEVTDAFAAQAVDTTIVELMDQILATMLDKELAMYLEANLKKNGVNILTSEKVLKFEGEDGVVKKVITDKREIESDMVIVAVGVRPNVQLAKDAGLEIGETGGIKVDAHMQTSDPDIYAGGDCVETTNLITGKKCLMPLGSVAGRQGRVIGDNVTGYSKDTFPGVIGTSMLKAMDLNVGKTGMTEVEARAAGYDVVTMLLPTSDKSHFFPGGKTVLLKMVADLKDQRVLGLQVIGPGDMPRNIDTMAAAITAKMTLHDVANLDAGYAPPYAASLSMISVTANAMRNKIDGLSKPVLPLDMMDRLKTSDDFVLLDIRKPSEIENFDVGDKRVVPIPLHELWDRIDELSDVKDKDICLLCQVGSRSYEGQVMLLAKGFARVSWLEGGISTWMKIV